jgi:hypothetical protein
MIATSDGKDSSDDREARNATRENTQHRNSLPEELTLLGSPRESRKIFFAVND